MELRIHDIFDLAQKSKLNHSECMKNMKLLYQSSDLTRFSQLFNKCLQLCFERSEQLPCIITALQFASKFTVSLSEGLGENETCPFLSDVFHFLLEIHPDANYMVRLRVCEFINSLLTDMGQDASLDDDLCERIIECLTARIRDKVPKVRAQAVYALHRLQQPNDESCNIIKVFLFHMSKDPSYEVRRAIVQKIAINRKTLPVLLKRVRDIKDVVRKEAYKVLSKIPVQRFTIKQRQKLLSCGLTDKSETVQEFVRDVLVKSWLKEFDFNYTEFLRALYVETNTDVIILALKSTFKFHPDVTLTLMLKEMYIEEKSMPYSRMTAESVVMWRAMAEYLQKKEGMEETFEQVLPDLTAYCTYIRQYFLQGNTGRDEPPNEYILMQLMEMTKLYDLSDEVGRQNLKQLCVDLLECKLVTETSATLISQLLMSAMPNLNDRLNKVAEIISELREPFETALELKSDDILEVKLKIAKLGVTLNELRESLQNAIDSQKFLEAEEIRKLISETEEHVSELKKKQNPAECNDFQPKDDVQTVKKCLTIVITILKAQDLRAMTPTLHSLMENFIIPCFQREAEDNKTIHVMALKCLGIFGLLDVNIAVEKFIMFVSLIGNRDVGTAALEIVFDYLHYYGIAPFNAVAPSAKGSEDQKPVKKNWNHLTTLLISLIDSGSTETQNIAVSGLCRLLYNRRLKSPKLVAKLILLWFTTNTEERTYIHQALGIFFSQYATRCPLAPTALVRAFPLVVKKLGNKDCIEQLHDVNQDSVIQLLLRLTQPRINKYVKKGVCVHNMLGIRICKSIANRSSLDTSLLARSLQYLQLDFFIIDDIKALLNGIRSAIQVLKESGDKVNHRFLARFSTQVEARRNAAVNPVTNIVGEMPKPDTTSTEPMDTDDISQFTLLTGKLNSSDEEESEDDYEDEEMESNQDEMERNDGGANEDDNETEKVTIPETPDSSEKSEDKQNNDEDDDDFDSEVSVQFETPARNTRSRSALSNQKSLKISTNKKN